jgi:hypothetical protein
MRRLLTWMVVTLGIATLVRRLKRRHKASSPAPSATVTAPTADPADELRQKLAATRSQEPSAPVEDLPDGTVAERRAEVHDDGRAALEEMRSRRASD